MNTPVIRQESDGTYSVTYQTSVGEHIERGFPQLWNALDFACCELGVNGIAEARKCVAA